MIRYLSLIVILMIWFEDCMSQSFATGQVASSSGMCVGCNVVTPANSLGNESTTYAEYWLTVGTSGQFLQQQFSFGDSASPGNDLVIMLQSVDESTLAVADLEGVVIETSLNGAPNAVYDNNDIVLCAIPSSDNCYLARLAATSAFDQAAVKLEVQPVVGRDDLRVYMVYHESPIPLAVNDLELQATALGQRLRFTWKVSGSCSYDYVEIERSLDGNWFNSEEVIPVTSRSSEYSYETNLNSELCYWRLAGVNSDGERTLGPVLAMQGTAAQPSTQQANRVLSFGGSSLNIDVLGPEHSRSNASIYDIAGRMVFHGRFENQTLHGLDYLPVGHYALLIDGVRDPMRIYKWVK